MIIHLSAECYPVAKVGGLADVVGALPKYQKKLGHEAKVVMPFYENFFTQNHVLEVVHQHHLPFGGDDLPFTVLKNIDLGFELYLIQVPSVFDREKVYGYEDDDYRAAIFQIAALFWMSTWEFLPDIIHCHDHQTGLVPFLMKYAFTFNRMRDIPTVFTIHNAEYAGILPWEMADKLPWYNDWDNDKLSWHGELNSLSSGIRNAWKVTAVSPQYMKELKHSDNPISSLLNYEAGKCTGILNGIDHEVWNPRTDAFLEKNYSHGTVGKHKQLNKKELCKHFGLNEELPLIAFIGRFAKEKGADLMGHFIWKAIKEHHIKANFLVMGSGNYLVEAGLQEMQGHLNGQFATYFAYDEAFAHLIYAGADFMWMPSRVEPCGLNQLYAMRYGTFPMVRTVGGLLDTVLDFEDPGGFGIRFIHLSEEDVIHAFQRAVEFYEHPRKLKIQQHMMQIDHSWEKAAKNYIALYQEIINIKH